MAEQPSTGEKPGSEGRDSVNHAPNVFSMPGPLTSTGNSPHHQAPQKFSHPETSAPSKAPTVDWNAVIDQLSFGLIVLGPDQELQHENSVCSEMLGCSVKDKGGIEAWLASHCPDDEHQEKVISSWRDHIWRNQLTRTFTLRGADQKLREIEFRSSLQTNGVLTLTLQDVTDIRRAEDTQRHNKLKFRALFSHTANGTVLVDRTGRIIDANPAFLEFVDLSLKEIRLSTLSGLLHPEDATALAEAEEAWRNSEDDENGDSLNRQVWLRARSQEKRTRLTYCPIGDSRQHPSMGIYLFDIGESTESREQLLNKLRTVALKAQALLNAVPDLVLLINKDLSIADFAPPPEPWKEIEPRNSWRGAPLAEIWPFLSELVQRRHESLLNEGKTIHADLQGRGEVPFDFAVTLANGGDDQILAVVRNKSLDEDRNCSPSWHSAALENASQGMLLIDEKGLIQEANPAAAELVGMTPSDLIQKPVADFYLANQGMDECLSSVLESGEKWTSKVPLKRPSGRDEAVSTEFIPVNEPGSPPCLVALISESLQEDPSSPVGAAKIQHRFRNQLQLVTSLFSLEPQGAVARDAFLKWQIRLRSIAQIMTSPTEGIQVVPMMRTIADEVCSLTGHGPSRREVEISGSESLRIDNNGAVSLALLVGEVMRLILGNRQYGPGPELFLGLSESENGNLKLQVRPGENRRFIFTDEDSEIEILEILTAQMRGELAPGTSESAQEWELTIPSDHS